MALNAITENMDNFRTKPFSHQLIAHTERANLIAWGELWEQGTGKSKAIIDLACDLFLRGKINAVVVIAPNGVHQNWVINEIPIHTWDVVEKNQLSLAYKSQSATTKKFKTAYSELLNNSGLSWLTIGYDSVITANGGKAVAGMLDGRDTLYVLDESHNIKNRKAKRTKTILKSARFSKYRRVLTGTPIANGAFDAYNMMLFLDAEFWKRNGFSTYTGFKTHFGIIVKISRGGNTFEKIVGYKNLDELGRILRTMSTRVLKSEVLDLPPKLYQTRQFDLTKEQSRLYHDIKEETLAFIAEDGSNSDGFVDGSMAMIQMLRLQQVTCGYVPVEGADEKVHHIPGGQPRLDVCMACVEEARRGVVIWTRFRLDIDKIMQALNEAGITSARIDGSVSAEQRVKTTEDFQAGKIRVLVVILSATTSAGWTWTAASTVIFYANSFDLVVRLQAEDRAHRIGQKNPVLYIDIVATDTVDEKKIIPSLRGKKNIAGQINGDDLADLI